MKNEIFVAVVNGNVELIKKYCFDSNGSLDKEKFMSMLKLEKDEVSKNKRRESALYIAGRNGHSELVDFIIEQAFTEDSCKELLKACLQEKSEEGKNTLHEAVNTPNNVLIIRSICKAAEKLGLKKYIDVKDNTYGNSALHLAARAASYENYAALVEQGASLTIESNSGIVPHQAIRYAHDVNKACVFLNAWITQSAEGKKYFSNIYGSYPFSEEILNRIIRIDLDSRITENSIAQLTAFKNFMDLIKIVSEEKEYVGILNALWDINFSVINEVDLKDESSELEKFLKEVLKKSVTIKIKTEENDKPDSKSEGEDKDLQKKSDQLVNIQNLYIRVTVLTKLRDFPEANKQAFNLYGSQQLYGTCPELVLSGLKQLHLDQLDRFTLAVRLTLIHISKKLNEINERQKGFLSAFFKPSTPIINKLRDDLYHVNSVQELVSLLQKLPAKDDVNELKNTILEDLKILPPEKPAQKVPELS